MIWLAFLVTFLSVCLGYGLAVYLAHRASAGAGPQTPPRDLDDDALALQVDPEQARKFLDRLQQLAVTVDDDVGRHTTRVTEISLELNGKTPDDSSVVLAAATHLIQANKLLQADLATAKSEIQMQQQKLDSYMNEARTDPLTGLANRRAFDQELKRRFAEWKRRGTPLSLLLVDIDHFKKVNDQYGHPSGDAVLRGVAHVLAATMRDMDVVARYGGEEFAIVLPGTTVAGARPAAERVRTAVAAHICETNGARLQVTVSIGGAEAVGADDPELLVKRTDECLYAAKSAGRNCTFLQNGEKTERVESSPASASQFTYNAIQRIAPFVDGHFPEFSMFCEVECEDISATGFTFLSAELPTYESVILAWETGEEVDYMTASVKNCWNIGTEIDPVFRIVCEFTARADLRTTPEPAVACQ